MFKRLMLIMLCLSVAILFSSTTFSQDKPTPADEKKVEDKAADVKKEPAPDAKKEAEAEKLKGTTIEAKTYVDGANVYVNSKVKFKLTTKDNFLKDRIEYKIDNGEVKKYDAPFTLPDEGTRVITYYGVDSIGNKENPKLYKVIVDNTPPVIYVTTDKPVLKKGDKVYISKDMKFKVDTVDELSGVNKVEYSLDGKLYREYKAPFNIPTDSGEINLKIRAVDNVTNVSEKYALKMYDETGKETEMALDGLKPVSDNVAPVVEIKSSKELIKKSGKTVASSDIKYSITATDADSGIAQVLVRIDEKGDYIPYTKEIQFLTNGEHVIEAKAVDKVGNVSPVVVLTVFVDVIPPESMIEMVEE